MEDITALNHTVIAEGRKKLNVSGVKDVLSFDEETIRLDAVLGAMTIKGEGLHILSFHTETGDLSAEGRLHAMVYLSEARSGGSLFTRIFR